MLGGPHLFGGLIAPETGRAVTLCATHADPATRGNADKSTSLNGTATSSEKIRIMEGEADYTHIRVHGGTTSSGRPAFEVLPARRLGEDYEIHGSPGLAYGFAAGDRIRLESDGTFEVMARGGNLCLRLYPTTPPSDRSIAELKATFDGLHGLVEMPSDRRFIVITVPIGAGFPAIEGVIGRWAGEQECVWEFGNVYGDNGEVLDWIGKASAAH